MAVARILIAGIGNIFLGDDGFGCEVTARLLRREWPAGVRVTDFGIRGLDLAYELSEGCDAAILVDAAPRGGVPGTIYVIEVDSGEPGDLNESGMQMDAHAMDPLSVLSLARSLGGEIGHIFIVGCEPLSLGPEEGRMGLSEPVAAAVDEAAMVVESLVRSVISF